MMTGRSAPPGKGWYNTAGPLPSDEVLRLRLAALLWEGTRSIRRMQMSTKSALAELRREYSNRESAVWSAKKAFVVATVAELKEMHDTDVHMERHSRVAALYHRYQKGPPGAEQATSGSGRTAFAVGMAMLNKILPGPVRAALDDSDDDVSAEFTIAFDVDDVVRLGSHIRKSSPAKVRALKTLLVADFGEDLLGRDVDKLRALPLWKKEDSARARLRKAGKAATMDAYAAASKTHFDMHHYTSWDFPHMPESDDEPEPENPRLKKRAPLDPEQELVPKRSKKCAATELEPGEIEE